MNNFQNFFKNKKVTVMGLGLLGKRLGDIAFMAECGAKVLVTDLKTAKELAPSIKTLKKYKNIKYVLGEHRFQDFENCDFVLKGQGVALDSLYIEHAKNKKIPVEMDESLFAKLAPKVKIIGVTGTRGKTTTTILIYEILKAAFSSPSTTLGIKKPSVFLGGNIKGTAALPLLQEVKDGDFVVFELSSWQLQGFGEAKISPHISVFTNFMPDHMNYYGSTPFTTSKVLERYFADKSYIYKFQKKNDVLILGPGMKAHRRKIKGNKSEIVNADIKNIPKFWHINLPGEHNLENISCAVEVARYLKIDEEIIRKVIKNFNPISGRLEFVKNIKGVKIYNDNNSTTPEATQVALKALSLILSGVGHPTQVSNTRQRKIILIMGGTDKNLELKKLIEDIKKYVKVLVLIPGNGTDRILSSKKLKVESYKVKNLDEALKKSLEIVSRQDIILFSPAFTSFGMFNNEYDRGDQFMKIVKTLK